MLHQNLRVLVNDLLNLVGAGDKDHKRLLLHIAKETGKIGLSNVQHLEVLVYPMSNILYNE